MASRGPLHVPTGALIFLALFASLPSLAQEAVAPQRHHALSLVEPPRFGPDFKHFDWVNPDAPKGGMVRQWEEGSFDSLNPFSIQGESAAGIGLIYDSLMVGSPDEPSAEYGLVAEWVSFPPDYSSVTFGLREGARFHDGRPITPEDVIFSFEALKKANPQIAHYYRNVVGGKKSGEREVTFTFDVTGNRELPQIMGQLQVLPRHFWEGKTATGEARDVSKSTLEIPLGSGPYRIKEVDRGRSITYERVADWWAKDLPVAKGQWNFDILRYEYYRERTAAFEGFKSGAIDYWEENSAKAWATEYNFPAVKRGQVKLERIPVKRVAPMQAFGFNLRRPQFQDVRVRRAFNLAFNFEAINEQLLYSEYTRTASYFENSELKATGLPKGTELEILKEVQNEVPPEVFSKEYRNSVGGPDAEHRRNLAEAARLLREAGWSLQGPLLRNARGETLKVEFLLNSPTFERHTLRYIDDLKKLGIDASVRIVDSAQYQRRRRSFDYDITTMGFAQSESPGNEQRFFWGSAAADQEGSRNAIGIKNPAIDKLIDRIIFAKDRPELVAATRALDRVLLWNYYVVPLWYYPYERLAYWNKFGRPAKLPSQTSSFERIWWFDKTAADKLAASGSQ
ncbi:MAG TPA: extracellular solute-binding protein [Hyphomicrobiaceae bacterium]|nr:extracellular solute-binding protein [Hyphomicrobiaceae bacterium]